MGNQHVHSDIDFPKAFDSFSHKSTWEALKSCGIEHDYIGLLKKIYRDHKASGQTDEESNMFEIKKGTNQGDPLSSLLFKHGSTEFTERRHPALAKEKKVWEST